MTKKKKKSSEFGNIYGNLAGSIQSGLPATSQSKVDLKNAVDAANVAISSTNQFTANILAYSMQNDPVFQNIAAPWPQRNFELYQRSVASYNKLNPTKPWNANYDKLFLEYGVYGGNSPSYTQYQEVFFLTNAGNNLNRTDGETLTNLSGTNLNMAIFGRFTTEFSDVVTNVKKFANDVNVLIYPATVNIFAPGLTLGTVVNQTNNLKSAVKKYKNFQIAIKNLKTWYDAGLGARLTQAQKVSMALTNWAV